MLDTVIWQRIKKERGHRFGAKNRSPSPRHSADEERANFLRCHLHLLPRRRWQQHTPGLKALLRFMLCSPG